VSVPASLSLAALKRRVDKQLSTDDDLLEEYLEEAFEQAQAPAPLGCGRLLTPDPPLVEGDPPTDTAAAVEKQFSVRGRRVLIPDAREITEVLVDDEAITEYRTTEQNGLVVLLNLPHDPRSCGYEGYDEYSSGDGYGCWCRRRRRTVKVTGRFGFLDIPATLKDAIYILAARAFYERDAQYADQVPVADGAPIQAYFRQLPPRAKLVFATYAVPEGIGGLS
jgi:hypothetical protein